MIDDKTKEIPSRYYTDPRWREAYEKSSLTEDMTFEEYIVLQRNLAAIERWRNQKARTPELVH